MTYKTIRRMTLPAALLMLIGSGCTTPASKTEVPMPMQPAQIGTLAPLQQQGTFYLGGQPTPDDLALAKAQGLKSVISLRTAGEIDWDEGKAVQDAGMTFHGVPFKAPETLTDEVFDQALGLLNDEANQPTLLHCKSANRVGAIWFAHRVVNEGVDPEQALAEAKTVGLRSAEQRSDSSPSR